MTDRTITPGGLQPPLPVDRLILAEPPGAERIDVDVLFVGGGPAGLAGAIELARLVRADGEAGGHLGDVQIGVLEKSATLGEHCLSGAVVNPAPFRELFPDLADDDFPFRTPVTRDAVYLLTASAARRLPVPPTMRNHGNFVASICEIVRWLGERAEAAGVDIFPGFPAASLLVEGRRVLGVRTEPSGLDRQRQPMGNHMPAADVAAKVTVLTEGTRGALAQAWYRWQEVSSDNPQIFALGVKELWETRRPLDRVVHTLGWPVPRTPSGAAGCTR